MAFHLKPMRTSSWKSTRVLFVPDVISLAESARTQAKSDTLNPSLIPRRTYTTDIENPPKQRGSNLPKDIWPLFDALVPDVTALPGWRALQQECPLYGCDFADVKFRCEFRLKHEVNDDAARLLAFASDWIRICPEALDLLDGDCHGDNALKALITAYRLQNPRKVPPRVERDSSSRSRLFSENPEQDRAERGFVNHLKEPYDGWDTIIFEEDPDKPERGEVEGNIKLAIAGRLDVALPSLEEKTSDKERHILVRESDYPDAAKRFFGTTEGRDRTFKKSADKALLRNKKRSDFKVLSHSCAKRGRHDLWPRTYTTAYLNNGDDNSSLNVWARIA
ncbi:hypothetical protein EDB81DRAFT_767842 [Dactylonectria macrodidyma]|uniref:Uncharacterized protein n=1 Tax=Dactylonectria macrodidyma TaxID=307937 RepID=A0A9P9D933_9HYPO|nr:hypothetical protein EDB81DRAFT_767842 [Dactylonectria macrodidyma]